MLFLGDLLEKFDAFEDLIKDAMDSWSSLTEAFRDTYPSEGYSFI